MNNDYNIAYEQCKNHMNTYVLAEMADGKKADGIITGVDDENVYLAVPIEQGQSMPAVQHQDMHRQYGNYGYGYGYPSYGHNYNYGYGYPGYGHNYNYGYGYPSYGHNYNYGYGYPGYGHPGYGYGYNGYPGYGHGGNYGAGVRPRFRRLVLPLAALTALSALPWY